jgi:hypothetical protein
MSILKMKNSDESIPLAEIEPTPEYRSSEGPNNCKMPRRQLISTAILA